jgi:type II secretory pathway pseudopilin PulG
MKAIAMRTARRGMTITEMVVSLGMLSALCLLVGQWFVVAAAQQARCEEQRYASQTAGNLMEQLFALPWDNLTKENSDKLASRAGEAAAECDCTAEISDVPSEVSGLRCKRIYIRVGHHKGRIPPVELMAWRHAREDVP